MGNIRKYIFGILALTQVMLAAVSCSREDNFEKGNVTLRAYACVSDHQLIETRAIPSGYVNYNTMFPNAVASQADIRTFLKADDSRYDITGKFKFDIVGREWDLDQQIMTGITYYIYGIMPYSLAESATIEKPAGGQYKDGAVLTIPSIDPVVANDLNVIVGVKRRMGLADDIDQTSIDLINAGKFDYETPYTEVYMQMMLDHMFAKLTFNMGIDPMYDSLRTVVIKKCRLETTTGPAKLEMSIPLTANTTGANPIGTVTYTQDGTSAGGGTDLIIGDSLTLTVANQTINAYLCPYSGTSATYKLITTYNVYDKKGNLIRKGCQATNSFSLNAAVRGEAFTMNAMVAPTYLYQLSSPDFDNPCLKLE